MAEWQRGPALCHPAMRDSIYGLTSPSKSHFLMPIFHQFSTELKCQDWLYLEFHLLHRCPHILLTGFSYTSLGTVPISSAAMAENHSHEVTYVAKELSFLPSPGIPDLVHSGNASALLHHRHDTNGQSSLWPELFLKKAWEIPFCSDEAKGRPKSWTRSTFIPNSCY